MPTDSHSFICGIFTGLAIAFVIWNFIIFSSRHQKKEIQKNKQQSDPANWWKYGKSPYDYGYEHEED